MLKHAKIFLIILVVALGSCAKRTPLEQARDMREEREKIERESAFPDMSFESQSPKRKASIQLTQEGFRESSGGYYVRAIKKYEQAIDLDPSNPYAYFHFGVARYGMKEYDQSLRMLDEARGKFGDNERWLSKIFTYQGLNYRALGRLDKAKEALTKALELDSRNELARQGLAEMGEQ